mmetsp:Transcript_20271/g.51313  ORF Transcript_20271/g.51313 Transcript_20271/m.51313 type:complete len:405 (-) Transcript_20271:2842-4056(-)|eukprot:CAMPEP_0202860174 /NCGR_PEP_ID=MMETSP1391-20130828/1996_1 /ASSEMBLY_ACC=CAM_ASM_000867 /TAXON_ID=1034604 /ORGANISM="Chlamydomonas leiostraca, Strain SAG 11-49" /LENGTH=404 /DNA_ID=CAMNT_0049539313 /DNA_START=186 /DNA_END=1400 /DNA_ORIENTATION=-
MQHGTEELPDEQMLPPLADNWSGNLKLVPWLRAHHLPGAGVMVPKASIQAMALVQAPGLSQHLVRTLTCISIGTGADVEGEEEAPEAASDETHTCSYDGMAPTSEDARASLLAAHNRFDSSDSATSAPVPAPAQGRAALLADLTWAMITVQGMAAGAQASGAELSHLLSVLAEATSVISSLPPSPRTAAPPGAASAGKLAQHMLAAGCAHGVEEDAEAEGSGAAIGPLTAALLAARQSAPLGLCAHGARGAGGRLTVDSLPHMLPAMSLAGVAQQGAHPFCVPLSAPSVHGYMPESSSTAGGLSGNRGEVAGLGLGRMASRALLMTLTNNTHSAENSMAGPQPLLCVPEAADLQPPAAAAPAGPSHAHTYVEGKAGSSSSSSPAQVKKKGPAGAVRAALQRLLK